MKTKKQSLGQWLLSLFFKSKKVKPSDVEIKTEEVVKDPFCKTYTSNEMPDLTLDDPNWVVTEMTEEIKDVTEETEKVVMREYVPTEKKEWKGIKKNLIEVKGKEYNLTDKQLFFYNHFKNAGKPVHGDKVAREFMYHISAGYSDEQFKAIKKVKFKICSHRMTMAGLIKTGLIKHLGNDMYKAKK